MRQVGCGLCTIAREYRGGYVLRVLKISLVVDGREGASSSSSETMPRASTADPTPPIVIQSRLV